MGLIPAQFLKGAFFSFVAALLTGICGYLTRRFMANGCTTDEYAFFYSVFSLLSLCIVFIRLGMSDVVLFELPRLLASGKYDQTGMVYSFIRRFQLISSAVAYFLLIIAIPFFQHYYFDFPVNASNLAIYFLAIWGLVLETTVYFALNSLKKFKVLNIIRSLKSVLLLCSVLAGIYLHSFKIIIVSFVLICSLCTLLGDRIASRSLPLLHPLSRSGVPPRILRSGLVFMMLSGGYFLMSDAGTVALCFFSSAEEVVLFNIALPIAMMVNAFDVVLQIFTPMFSEYFIHDEKKKLNQFFLLLSGATILCMISVLPILYCWGEWLIKILFSERFVAAKFCTLFLVEASILAIPVKAFFHFFNAVGMKTVSAKVLIPVFGGALIFFPLLAYYRGANGAGAATLVVVLIWLISYIFAYVKMRGNK